MFTHSLRRETLAAQVAIAIRSGISEGRWNEWLPAERHLMQMFNLSRGTLREGLKRLVASGEIEVAAKEGYRILAQPMTASRLERVADRPQIVLLCPEQVYSMPSYVVQLVDLLRAMAARDGLPVEIIEGRRFARTDPDRYMQSLLRSYPGACWVPVMADRRLQQWFAQRGAPKVIYGNVYPDIPLAGVGIDYRACLYHAASHLLAKGHRRIALVAHDTGRAGDQESLRGFHEAHEACTTQRGIETSPLVMARPDDDAKALCRQIDRAMATKQSPTAFIVCRAHHYGTVATRLLETGYNIPRDVSLVCRGEDVFLRFLSPTPSLYRVNVEVVARRLFRSIMNRIEGSPATGVQDRIVPEFVPGATVAAPSNTVATD